MAQYIVRGRGRGRGRVLMQSRSADARALGDDEYPTVLRPGAPETLTGLNLDSDAIFSFAAGAAAGVVLGLLVGGRRRRR